MMRTLILTGMLAMLASPALASSPDAWAQLYRQAGQRCVAASRLKNAQASKPIVFSDASGQLAMLVTGTFPQRHMKGASGTSLCLYDRRSKTAQVEEAGNWRAER